jgi:hypothetical protein
MMIFNSEKMVRAYRPENVSSPFAVVRDFQSAIDLWRKGYVIEVRGQQYKANDFRARIAIEQLFGETVRILPANSKNEIHAQTGDVWTLESENEEVASQMLSQIAQKAIEGDTANQQYLTTLWDGERWESIQKKLMAEGSTWYVWWMDGVRRFASQMDSRDVENEDTGAAPEGERIMSPDSVADTYGFGGLMAEGKKKKKKVNPWAVCTKSVGRKNKDKYESCVLDVKKKHHIAFNASKMNKQAQRMRFKIMDTPFNRKNYPDMIGKITSSPPGFAQVQLFKEGEIPCRYCGKPTSMTGTKLCNTCWAIDSYFQDSNPNEESDKAYVKRLTEKSDPQLVEKIRQYVEQKKKGKSKIAQRSDLWQRDKMGWPFKKTQDGKIIKADKIMQDAYGKIPMSNLFFNPNTSSYEEPVRVEGFDWSDTFHRWGASVEFKNGWKGFTWPQI